ncbi:aminotransferase class I/II-fold pyridoxal phosphate-dependent enzyme [Actinomadura bangladeshensis]|uniref:Aminotransferase class I/II-fold pyridoxal phosphate-dependent enzyme n=1 Tax=Actinomadura bangladeshensis TaxID=453573 RepID=A0A6L9QD86_9ACTN|nr:aminotransferase class I/II-fold pyridoxal phosphate-dependent enzyme [Actinomadura bangladeshensis]
MLDLLMDLGLVVVDESFLDFVDAEPHASVAYEARIRPTTVVLKSLGKNFGLHGVRFGYMVANPALARTVRAALPKWNFNSFAEVVVFLLREHGAEYREVFPSQGNFILVKLPDGRHGAALRDHLVTHHGVFVRECGNKLGSTSRFLRLVVRPQPAATRSRRAASPITCANPRTPIP